MKAWIGIDPGATGAAALITAEGEAETFDYPGDLSLVADQLRSWRMKYKIELATLEHVHAMPKQGICSMFSLGMNAGGWQGVLAGLAIPFLLVKPRQWQNGILLKQDGPDTKSQSLAAARRLWPDMDLGLKRHHGRADALHLADYARRRAGNQ